jgi:hypothetical protein
MSPITELPLQIQSYPPLIVGHNANLNKGHNYLCGGVTLPEGHLYTESYLPLAGK